VNSGGTRLHTKSLTKSYGGSKGKRALDQVDLDIPSRGIFSLIGMNGAGKTTLVRILATQLEPTSGEASIDGLDVMKDARKLRDRIACVPQEARTAPFMTAKQTVLSYLLWRGVSYGEAGARATEALGRVGLSDQVDVLNRKLSGGTKRKVLVAAVLSSDADIIFLDEPTTGLDPLSRRDLWELLTGLAKERFLVLTTHYLEEAERLASMIGILHSGRLIGLGDQDHLRKTVRYQYSLMLPSTQALPRLREGEVTVGSGGQTQILTSEAEAHELSRSLFDQGVKFTMSKVSLDDVFFHLVHGAVGEEKE
jgi:ABC-2 type transport system ATP-binding protein